MTTIFQVLLVILLGYSWNSMVIAISCPNSASSLDEASRDKILETVNRDRELIRRGELVLTNGEHALQGAFMKNLTWDCNVEAKVAEKIQAMCNGSYGPLSIFEIPYTTSLYSYGGMGEPISNLVNTWISSNSFNASTFLKLATDTQYILPNDNQFTAYYLSDVGKTIGCATYQCPARNWTQLICKTSPSVDMNEIIYVPGDPAVVTTPEPEPVCAVPETLLTSAHRTRIIYKFNEKRTQALNGTLKLYDGKYAIQAQQMPMLTWDCEMEAQMNAVVEARCIKPDSSKMANESVRTDNERYNIIDYYVHEFSKTDIGGVSMKFLSNTTYGIILNYHRIDQRILHDKATKIGCAITQCDRISGSNVYPSTTMICTFDVNWMPLVNGSKSQIYEPRSNISTTVSPVTPSTTYTVTPRVDESTGCTTHYGDATTPAQPAVTTPVEPEVKNCSEGYVYLEATHSCYGRGPELGLGWNTFPKAEQYCERQGGHLASIHSEEENKLIVSLGAVNGWGVWVGLYSIDENYSWKWSDATPLDYVPWFYGNEHPLYPAVNASCAYAYPYYDPRGSLVNDYCSNEQYFVCQLPAQS